MDGRFAAFERGDLLRVIVHADDLVTDLSEARSSNESHVPGTYDRDPHLGLFNRVSRDEWIAHTSGQSLSMRPGNTLDVSRSTISIPCTASSWTQHTELVQSRTRCQNAQALRQLASVAHLSLQDRSDTYARDSRLSEKARELVRMQLRSGSGFAFAKRGERARCALLAHTAQPLA